jgi:hypothetical protein
MPGFRNSVSGLQTLNLAVSETESSVSSNSLKYSRLGDRDWRLGFDPHCAPQHAVLWPIGELPKRAVGSDRSLVADFTVLLTAKTMHALFGPSQRKWIAL